MAKYAIYSTSLGTAAGRPVVGEFDVDDLPEDTFAARLADAAGDVPAGHFYIQLTAGTYFSDLDGDASTYDYTVNTTLTPPVSLTAVTVDRYSLEEKQSQVANRRDLLLLGGLQLLAGDRRMTETDLGSIATYLAALRAIPDAPASPDTVSWPTLAALSENSYANLALRSYRQSNIVAAVGLTGGGLPNGGVVETGTNANGMYLRTADGGQICRARLLCTYQSASVLAAGWTLPAAPVSTASHSLVAMMSTRNNANAADGFAAIDIQKCQVVETDHGASSCTVAVRSNSLTFVSGDACWVNVIDFGRWAA